MFSLAHCAHFLTYVSQGVRIQAVWILQTTIRMNPHHIVRRLPGVKSLHKEQRRETNK